MIWSGMSFRKAMEMTIISSQQSVIIEIYDDLLILSIKNWLGFDEIIFLDDCVYCV